jgi:hypothetical protein
LEEVDFPRAYVFTGYLLKSVDMPTDQVRRMIPGINEGLFIATWKVLKTAKEKSYK